MVEISQNNPIDNTKIIADKRIITLDTPGKVPSQEVYSYTKSAQLHRQIENDVYEGEKKAKAPHRKFPKVLKILGGIIGIGALVVFRKSIFNTIKGIFKKPPVSP